MNHILIIILCLSALINLVLVLWLLGTMQDVKFFQKDSGNWYERWRELKMKEGNGKMSTVPAEVMQQMNDLQTENAQLRADVETGCKIIDEQKDRLAAINAETRRILASIKHRK